MTNQTLPSFTGRHIQGGLSETKHQSRIRNDVYATEKHYAKRPLIDRRLEEMALERELREWSYDD